MTFATIDEVRSAVQVHRYIMEEPLATSLFLSLNLERPLFLEGEAGVGKTELARVLARCLDTDLIRLQCYEGLDINTAVYEWDYPRQMLEIRLQESRDKPRQELTRDIFSERFLLKRPILRALENTRAKPPVLLIDEIDRADEEFEAYLLEVLSDFAVTIPEIGTVSAEQPPHVIITSNRTREVHDALKRRCLYHWIDYPTSEQELEIISARIPDAGRTLAAEVVAFVQRLRLADLMKSPGVGETLDWVAALRALGAGRLDSDQINRTLGVLLKYQEDITLVRESSVDAWLDEIRAAG